MAYCNECGAYIPDGQTVCLACGYDPAKAKEKKTVGSGGFAYEFDSNVLKDEIEKQKQRIKEESKKWAEEEKARREANRNNDANRYNRDGDPNSNGDIGPDGKKDDTDNDKNIPF